MLDPHSLRPDFPILHQTVHRQRPLVYFDNAASTQHPTAVLDAMDDCYRQHYANVHRGIHTLSERMTVLYEQARGRVQTFLNANDPREVIFTAGTTAGINLVAHSLGSRWQAGDEIILTEMEHHSNIVPWQQLAARQGLVLRWVRINEEGELDLEHFRACLNERTKLVAVTLVSNVLGVINPVDRLISWSHDCGALVLLDAAQAAPHMPIDVQALNCDFLVFSGHKIVGPTGIGVLYGRHSVLETMPPFLGGGSMIDTVEISGFTPAELPARFEAGTPPIVEAVGLAAAIDYVSQVGMEAIDQHERTLAERCLGRLSNFPQLKILGPSDMRHRVGLVSMTGDKINAQDFAKLLDFRGFAARAGHHCAMPLHQRLGIPNSLRVSFYLYNTLEEVDAFCDAIPQILERLS